MLLLCGSVIVSRLFHSPASITITGTTQVRVEGGTGVSDPSIREVAVSAGNLSDGEAAIAAARGSCAG